jgi:hypothetical protein
MPRALRVLVVATLFLVPLAVASVVTAHAVPLPGDVIAAAPRAAGLPAATTQQPGKATDDNGDTTVYITRPGRLPAAVEDCLAAGLAEL